MSSSIWVEFRIHGNICITEKSPYSPKLFFCFLFFIIYFLAVLLSFCPFYSTLEMTLVDFFYLILESTANWSARKDFLGQEEDNVHGTLPPPLNVWLHSGSISRFRLGEFFPGSCDCRLEIAEWSKGEGGKKTGDENRSSGKHKQTWFFVFWSLFQFLTLVPGKKLKLQLSWLDWKLSDSLFLSLHLSNPALSTPRVFQIIVTI